MATFNVEIALSGAAFEDSGEVARILRALADKVEVQVISSSWARDTEVTFNNDGSWSANDINGNRVASAWVEVG